MDLADLVRPNDAQERNEKKTMVGGSRGGFGDLGCSYNIFEAFSLLNLIEMDIHSHSKYGKHLQVFPYVKFILSVSSNNSNHLRPYVRR